MLSGGSDCQTWLVLFNFCVLAQADVRVLAMIFRTRQAAGEAEYTADIPATAGSYCGAIANTLQASGIISSIDLSVAAGMYRLGYVCLLAVSCSPLQLCLRFRRLYS